MATRISIGALGLTTAPAPTTASALEVLRKAIEPTTKITVMGKAVPKLTLTQPAPIPTPKLTSPLGPAAQQVVAATIIARAPAERTMEQAAQSTSTQSSTSSPGGSLSTPYAQPKSYRPPLATKPDTTITGDVTRPTGGTLQVQPTSGTTSPTSDLSRELQPQSLLTTRQIEVTGTQPRETKQQTIIEPAKPPPVQQKTCPTGYYLDPVFGCVPTKAPPPPAKPPPVQQKTCPTGYYLDSVFGCVPTKQIMGRETTVGEAAYAEQPAAAPPSGTGDGTLAPPAGSSSDGGAGAQPSSSGAGAEAYGSDQPEILIFNPEEQSSEPDAGGLKINWWIVLGMTLGGYGLTRYWRRRQSGR